MDNFTNDLHSIHTPLSLFTLKHPSTESLIPSPTPNLLLAEFLTRFPMYGEGLGMGLTVVTGLEAP
jgi:hypothetical protein